MKSWVYGKRMTKVSIIYKLKSLFKKHSHISIFLILILGFYSQILFSDKIHDNIHYINDLTFQNFNVLNSLEQGQIHLWSPYFFGGTPFLAIPEYYVLDLNMIYVLIFHNIFIPMDLTIVSYIFIAGLGMFLLALYFTKNKTSSLISSIAFTFSAFVIVFILNGHINLLAGYAMMPFVFLFTYKALIKKEWIKNSIYAGIFLALQILAGSMIFFLYTLLLLGLLFAFNLIKKNFVNVLIKTILVSLLILIICSSLSAVKLLPSLEFSKISNRSAGVSKQEFLGSPIPTSDIFDVIILRKSSVPASIGFMGITLAIFSLAYFRKRIVLFSAIVIILSILIATGSFVSDILFNLPGYSQMRHVERAIVLFVFCASLLSGFGFLYLKEWASKNSDMKKYVKFLGIIVISILIIELILVQKFPVGTEFYDIKNIDVINYMKEDKSDFRVINTGLSDLIGPTGYNYYGQAKIPSVKGGGGIWINEYVEFVGVALQYNKQKFLSILNTKYLVSKEEENITGFRVVDKFNECEGDCAVGNAWGPYLYENTDPLPRSYTVSNAILVLGDEKDTRNLIYNLMLNNIFDPKKIVLIHKESLDDIGQQALQKYKGVILTKQPSDSNIQKLSAYKSGGGIILPDIFEGQSQLDDSSLTRVFKINGSEKHSESEITFYSPNKIKIKPSKEGFLVLSERYAYFNGWEAYSEKGKNYELLKADNVITTLIIDEPDEITFEFRPKSFNTGKIISILSVSGVLLYFIIISIKKRRVKNG